MTESYDMIVLTHPHMYSSLGDDAAHLSPAVDLAQQCWQARAERRLKPEEDVGPFGLAAVSAIKTIIAESCS